MQRRVRTLLTRCVGTPFFLLSFSIYANGAGWIKSNSIWTCDAPWTFSDGDQSYQGSGPTREAAIAAAREVCNKSQGVDDNRRVCDGPPNPQGLHCNLGISLTEAPEVDK
jgi:hypothetical protein